jgi:hypothetical protein
MVSNKQGGHGEEEMKHSSMTYHIVLGIPVTVKNDARV